MGKFRNPLSLCEAIYQKNVPMIDAFLEKITKKELNEASFDRPRSRNLKKPLEVAVTQGDLETVKKLLARGADASATGYISNEPIIFKAVHRGDLEITQLLHQYGAPLHKITKILDSKNLVSEAVSSENIELLQWVIDQGVGINFTAWRTPLDMACTRADHNENNLKIFFLLLDQGAEIKWQKNNNFMYQPALSECIAYHKHSVVLDALLERTGQVNQFFFSPNSNMSYGISEVPLVIALLLRNEKQGRIDLLKSLISHGVKLDYVVDLNLNTIGWNVGVDGEKYNQGLGKEHQERMQGVNLLTLSALNSPECFDLLKQQNQDVFIQDKNGNNLLNMLLGKVDANPQLIKEMLPKLLEEGVSPSEANQKGITPFHRLIRFADRGHDLDFDLIALCIEYGADIKSAFSKHGIKRENMNKKLGIFLDQLATQNTLQKSTPQVQATPRRSMRL